MKSIRNVLRRKIIKKEKLSKVNNSWEKDIGRVIGVTGTTRGCGSTYISLLIANSLKRLGGRKIAWIDMSGKGVSRFILAPKDRFITSYMEGLKEREDGAKCSYKGVDYYENGSGNGLLEAFNESYDHIVIDFGNVRDSPSRELLRCDIKVLVGLASPWKRIFFERYILSNKETMGKGKWRYVFNLTSGKRVKRFRSIYGIKAVNVEYEEDFEEIENNFERILVLLMG